MQFTPTFRRRALVAALSAIYGVAPQLVQANPTGAQVANGQASLQTQGNKLTVTNTPGAIINWQSFSIKAGETTYFQQQNAASAVLNRVQTQNPNLQSRIDGTLGSNGRVFLINPNGIVFGAGSIIDTQGFVASTLSMNDDDFKAGRHRFARQGAAGDIQAQGRISSGNGDVYLVAPNIAIDGTAAISSQGGNIVLAAGEVVEITGRNLNDITFTVQNNGNQVLNLGNLSAGAVGVFAGTLTHSGAIQAQTLARDGGKLVLKAQGSLTLGAGSRTLADGEAAGGSVTLGALGGNITLDGGALVGARALAAANPQQAVARGGQIQLEAASGMVSIARDALVTVQGGRGGTVLLNAAMLAHDGAVRADGLQTAGGDIVIDANRVVQSAGALLSATGELRGGDIRMTLTDGTAGSAHLYTSGTLDASAVSGIGGTVRIGGGEQNFVASQIYANGDAGGGALLIGGGRSGLDASMVNADNVTASAQARFEANARVDGDGGQAVLWADGSTRFAGSVEARGGSSGGNGGFIEVSGKESVQFSGQANASAPLGRNGSFLLDPRFIRIQTPQVASGAIELIDPNPGNSDVFGQNLLTLGNGNILVFNSTDDLPNASNAGAVYLYDGTTGALISQLRGSATNDQVGSGNSTTALVGGNFMVRSPLWNGSAGAWTVFNPATGASGTVSAANSLVGAAPLDQIGSAGLQTLSGKLVFRSPNFAGGAGAITWGDPTNGVLGVVSSANSLVGTLATDGVGSAALVSLGGGKFYSRTANWNSAAAAITFIDMAAPVVGAVGVGNSLVGLNPNDNIGNFGITNLFNGKSLVRSPGWDGNKGAVTWFNNTTGTFGVVDASTSLVGSTAGTIFTGDRVGELSHRSVGSRIVIRTPNWSNTGVGTTNSGAVTMADAVAGIVGVIDGTNSLVGDNNNDRVGDSGFVQLSSGMVYLRTGAWNSSAGAITFFDPNSVLPLTGTVGPGNSLVGAAPGDNIGNGGIYDQFNGRSIVFSPHWGGEMGAVTWFNNDTGTFGAVGAGNSLVGSTVGDLVGGFGNFVRIGNRIAIRSPNWDNTGANTIDSGAVTFVDLSTGVAGMLDATNSLVGNNNFDFVGNGSPVQLSNGKYYLHTAGWNSNAGAITFVDPNSVLPLTGTVGPGNSLVGMKPGDNIGNYGIDDQFNGRSLVRSPDWDGNKGAVTWFNNNSGTFGTVDATTSLVGSTAGTIFTGDRVGEAGYEYVGSRIAIKTPNWNNTGAVTTNSGAVTFADAVAGIVGPISATNSLVGDNNNDRVGDSGFVQLSSGMVYLRTGAWNGSAGAITFVDPNSALPLTGTVGPGNSLVGAAPGDNIGNGGIYDQFNGRSIVFSPNWGGDMGAVTWFNNDTGTFGVVGAGNSLVGSTPGDQVGGLGNFEGIGNNRIAIKSPNWSNAVASTISSGAVTFVDVFTGVAGVLNATNSLVGNNDFDFVGNGSLVQLSSGKYYLHTGAWNGNAGAITFVDPNSVLPLTGIVGPANSLVGATPGDNIGSRGIYDQFNGRSIVFSPNWGGNMGAVSWFNNDTGTFGVVGAGNSLVGSTPGDQVGGFGDFEGIGNNRIAIRSPHWSNTPASTINSGAVTFADVFTGVAGVLDATNSLVGNNNFDFVGNSSLVQLSSGKYYLHTAGWNGNAGAITFVDPFSALPLTGIVGPGNSLVGAPGDNIGNGGGIRDQFNGRSIVFSPDWGGDMGAVSWFNNDTGTFGVVGAGNSLVGSTRNDRVGGFGDFAGIGNNRIAIRSPSWSNTGAGTTNSGAVTFADAVAGIVGPVGVGNSLIGDHRDDRVGGNGFVQLSSGKYYLPTTNWNGNAGAITFVDPNSALPLTGIVGPANSLVGANPGDSIGSSGAIDDQSNGRSIVFSPSWGGGKGAVTWFNNNTGTFGTVGAANSLVGSTITDQVGGFGDYAYVGGKIAIKSRFWTNTVNNTLNAGAVTFADPVIGVTGAVSPGNSLVGDHANDQVGNNNFDSLGGGKFFLDTRTWNGSAGAITFIDPAAPPTGVVGPANSLVGASPGDRIGSDDVDSLGNGKSIVFSPFWGGGKGAVTWYDNAVGTFGTVGASNSLVGSTADIIGEIGVVGDRVGRSGYQNVGSYLALRIPNWNNIAAGTTRSGAITFADRFTGITGVVSESNSLVGDHNNDRVGNSSIQSLGGGKFYVRATDWNAAAGSVTLFDSSMPPVGVVSGANSLVGQVAADGYGNNFNTSNFGGGRLLVRASNADSGGKTNNGRVHIYLGGGAGGDGLGSQLYADRPGQTVTISPAQILAILASGTDVVLQASSDITLEALSDILVNNPNGNGGRLTLQAGRSVLLNSNISTDNGNVLLIANDHLASGVVTAQREAGAANITMANGTLIDAGTGNVDIQLRNAQGRSGDQALSGMILLRSITAANLSVATDAGNIQIGEASASAPSLIKLSGDATLRSGSTILVQGGAQGAQAELSADGQISLFVNAPDLELRSGGSFARIVNPTNQFALKLGLPTPLAIDATTACTTCVVVSPFEITGTSSELIDIVTASILGMNPIPEPEVTEESKGEIEVDAGETCN